MRSGIGPAAAWTVNDRRRRAWQGARPGSRISAWMSSSPHSTPRRRNWAARLPFAGQLLSQLDAPYNPRGHNLSRSCPSRHEDQSAHRMTTGTVDLVREDY